MHEAHIVQNIVDQIIEKAKQSKAIKVLSVELVKGELAGLEEGSIRIYFEDFSKGTVLEGAELVVRTSPVLLKCNKCGWQFNRQKDKFDCPKCTGAGILAGSGKEFYIDKIEVETAD